MDNHHNQRAEGQPAAACREGKKAMSKNHRMPAPLISQTELLATVGWSMADAIRATEHRADIERVLTGNSPQRLVILGPCSIHDYEEAIQFGANVAKLQQKVGSHLKLVMRVYGEKPRTGKGWKGFIHEPEPFGEKGISDGLLMMARLLASLTRMGVAIAVEALDPTLAHLLAPFVSYGAVGARTSESQVHREMASGLPYAVGFKNTVHGDVDVAVAGAVVSNSGHEVIAISGRDGRAMLSRTSGNPMPHVILRGGSDTGPNCAAGWVERVKHKMTDNGLLAAIVIDCSHGNKRGNEQLPTLFDAMGLMQVYPCIRGVMLEVNLLAGKQSIDNCLTTGLLPGVSVTDYCMGWGDAEDAVKAFLINAGGTWNDHEEETAAPADTAAGA